MSRGVHGNSGAQTGERLLQALETLGCTGTLILERAGGATILLLQDGRLSANYRLGTAGVMGHDQLPFHFEPHAASAVPLIGSRFPHSVVPALRAVPDLAFVRQPLLDLQALVGNLAAARFTGALALAAAATNALLLFLDGALVGATCDEDGRVRAGAEALRTVRRTHVEEPEAELWLRDLPQPLVRLLLGMLLGTRAPAGAGDALEVAEEGYSYLVGAQVVLRVTAELRGPHARYAAPETLGALRWPDEPPGWEQRRYQLTLRGRDALNPMTEVSLAFQKSHGRPGRKLLEHLERGLSLEAVAQLMGTELADLKPWIETFEREGLTRSSGQ